MDEELENSTFAPFRSLPHSGLSRMADSMKVLGISMLYHHWKSAGTEDFPRIERHGLGGVIFSLGVSRRPFVGHISWASVHRPTEYGDSAILRLMYFEQDKHWIREYTPGRAVEPEFDRIIGLMFPEGKREIKLENEMLVNVVLQHFFQLFDLE